MDPHVLLLIEIAGDVNRDSPERKTYVALRKPQKDCCAVTSVEGDLDLLD
jgi:hypothetical protein